MKRKSFFQVTFDELLVEFKHNGFPVYAAEQVYSWIYKHFVFEMIAWTNVSKVVKAYLNENYSFDLPKVLWHGQSVDGTRKFLIGLHDGQSIETVMIPARDRLTLCVSSQVGCAIGCRFCHTGTMGLKRNLDASEVVGQLMAVTHRLKEKVTNVVYMGQGEPLHNFENMKQATLILMEARGLALGQRKITLSTSGLVPQIEKLSEFPPVNVAISLHAAHNNIRSELMPINKTYDLERLFKAIKEIPLKAHRFITYEYILIDGLNDRLEDAEALIKLLDNKNSKVNIIPFNQYPDSVFKRPTQEKILWFQNILNAHRLVCTTRVTKGSDILAACGQLKGQIERMNCPDSQNS